MVGPPAKLVGQESAAHGAKPSRITAVEQNHSNIIKFKKQDETYALVKGALSELIEGSPKHTDAA